MRECISTSNLKRCFSVILTATLIVSGFFIFSAGTALAEHTASVTVSPQYVKGGVPETYTFTVANNGNDAIYKITIKTPTDSAFLINTDTISCPTGWTKDASSNSSQAVCITDPFGGSVLGSGSYVQISFSATSPDLENDVQYNWVVVTKDTNGGYEYTNDTSAKTTVDVTPPTTQAIGIPGDWVNYNVTVTLTCNDGTGSGCKETKYQICDENGENCGSEQTGNSVSITCSAGSVCKHTIKYYSIDNVDNTEETKTSGVIKIDKKAPETSATVGTPKYETDTTTYITSDTQITLEGSDGETGSGVDATYYKIDDGSEQTYSESNPITISSEGSHTITYWSEDKVGNVETPVKTLEVYVDDTPPTVGAILIEPFYSDDETNYVSGLSTISAPVSDGDGSGVASCEYTLNADDANPTWNSATYDPQNNICKAENVDTSGANSINFRAIDNLGNSDEGSAVAVSPDTAGPTISNPSIDPSSPSNDNTPTITFGISDDKSGVKSESVQISDGSNTYTPTCSDGSCSYTFTSPLADGTYTFTISASDNVGNSASDSSLTGYIIDTQDPTTFDNYGEKDGVWQKTDQTITLTPSDPEPSSGLAWTRYCTDDGSNVCDPTSDTASSYTGPVTISTEGTTYFRYASKDNAGNVQDTVSREIKIDKTAPTVSVLGAPSDWTKETQTASVSCQDGLSGCNEASYKLYISDTQPTDNQCPTNPDDYTLDSPQDIISHSWVCAYAEDNAGNGAVSSPVEFKVDQTDPNATLSDDITDGIDALTDWQNTDAEISLTYDDEGGSDVANAYLNVVPYGQTCTPSTPYSEGTIIVSQHSTACWKVVDNAGNEVSGSAEIKVDKIPPSISGYTLNSEAESVVFNPNSASVEITINTDEEVKFNRIYICSIDETCNDDTAKKWFTQTDYSATVTKPWDGKDKNSNIVSDGEYKIKVKMEDRAGNLKSEELTTYTITVDTQNPTVTISSPQNTVYKSTGETGSVELEFTPTDPTPGTDLTCSYKVDDDTDVSISCTSGTKASTVVTDLSDGRHTITVNVTDAAGNSVSEGVSFVVDLDNTLTVDDDEENNPDFTSIQAAIDAASEGDTIIVAPGTYHETHEHGPGGGVAVEVPWFAEDAGGLTIKSSEGPENTIIDCDMGGADGCAASGVKIVSNNITFDGFTIKNAYTAVGQVSGKGNKLSNLIISDFGTVGLELMAVHNCTFSNITIHTNRALPYAGGTTKENGTVKGIDIQEYASGGNSNNTFEDITIYDIETAGDWGVSYGIYWEGDNAGTHPSNDNTFTNLTIHDIKATYFARGLYLQAGDTNAIENATFSGGSVYNIVDTDDTTPAGALYAWGIYIRGGVNNVNITGFNITNCNKGIYVSHSSYPPSQNVDIHFNNIYGNTEYGVQDYDGNNDVNAEFNWWGCPEGPGNADCDSVSENVDYEPWLKASKDSAPVRENGQPTGYVNKDTYTDTLTLSLKTDRPATCRYSETGGTDYNSMTGTFTTTDGTSHSVDLSNLAEGEHTYYVRCKSNIDGEPVNSDDYEISFTVDTVAPYITGGTPTPSSVGIDPATNIEINFSEPVQCSNGDWSSCITITDGDGNSISGTVEPDMEDNYKVTFIPTNNLASNSKFTVVLTGVIDMSGNELVISSPYDNWTFTTATRYEISLLTGWNLISFPVTPTTWRDVEGTLGNAKDKIESIWTYDGFSGEWSVYTPDGEDNDTISSIEAGHGYWVKAKESTSLTGSGTLYEQLVPSNSDEMPSSLPQVQLGDGWNLIGYYQLPNTESMDIEHALSKLAGSWTGSPNDLITFEKGTLQPITPIYTMEPGVGYWIFMTKAAKYSFGSKPEP